MDCKFKNREAFIEKYLRKELNEPDMGLFEEHFVNCEECFSELESTQQMMEMIQEEGDVLFPEYNDNPESRTATKFQIGDLVNKIFPPKWYSRPSPASTFIAASLIIFGIYLVILSVEFNSETPKTELYAANYIESDNLEYVINQQYRGSEELNIISPENGITVTEKILFNWEIEAEEQLFLKILNNEEDVLFKFTLNGNEFLFNAAENKLDPGLYYWKLESDDELLHIGKFLVKE